MMRGRPNLLQFSVDAMVFCAFRKCDWFISETDLLACYDFFSYPDRKQLPRFVYI
jgi:hypothetical protein